MSEFNDAFSAQENKNNNTQDEVQNYFQYVDYLHGISNDPAGLDPADLLHDREVNIIGDFVETAEREDFRNSDVVDLRVRRTGRDMWKRPKDAKFSPNEQRLLTRQVWEGRAYKIGSLAVGNIESSADLIVCDDGLLRVDRNPSVFMKSAALGYGKIPEEIHGYQPKAKLYKKRGNDPKILAADLAKALNPDKPRNKPSEFI